MPVTAYSTTAASNNAAPPNGMPEGMAPSAVNDTVRQIMADIAVEAQTNNVKVLKTVAGTDTITADMGPELAAYVAGMIVVFTPAATNTGAVTIAIDGLTALDIQKRNGDALIAGDLVIGIPAVMVLDSGADDFILLNPLTDALGDNWSVDSTGRLVNGGNTQPMFNAQRVTSAQTLTPSTVSTIVFNQENTDQGSNYDTTTGVFTAPVAGIYQFSTQLMLTNNATGSATINGAYFSINNATGSGTERYELNGVTLGWSINAASNTFTIGASITRRLAATDTVRVKVDLGAVGGSGSFASPTGSSFTGYLVG